jgi:hypothetical protein
MVNVGAIRITGVQIKTSIEFTQFKIQINDRVIHLDVKRLDNLLHPLLFSMCRWVDRGVAKSEIG